MSASVLFRFTGVGGDYSTQSTDSQVDTSVSEQIRGRGKPGEAGYLLIITLIREERASLPNSKKERKGGNFTCSPLSSLSHPIIHPFLPYPDYSMRHRQTLRIPPLPMGVWCQSRAAKELGKRVCPGLREHLTAVRGSQ